MASAVHYPSPLHHQLAMEGKIHVEPGDLAVSTAAAKEVLCLPIFPELTNEEHERVCGAVRELFGG